MSIDNRTERKRRRRQAQRATDLQLFEENALALALLSQNQDEEQFTDDESDAQENKFSDVENANCRNDDAEMPQFAEEEKCDDVLWHDEESPHNTSSNPNNTSPTIHDGTGALLQCEDTDVCVNVSVKDNSQCREEVVGDITCDLIKTVTSIDDIMDVDSSDDCCSNDESAVAVNEPYKFENYCLNESDVSPEVWKIITGVKKERTREEEFKIKLAVWSAKYHIQRNALDELLHTLKEYGHTDLPACAKTLLKTPRSAVDLVKTLAGGQFWYRGLKSGLMTSLTKEYIQNLPCDTVELDVFIDGLSPYKSVRKHLWPIAGCLKGKQIPFVIALWCGCTKEPTSVTEFFEDFVEEAADLMKNGFVFQGKKFKFIIRRYIADAPARAWMRNVKPHNSYNSCERCTSPGEWKFRRITYNPAHDYVLRTDESFGNQTHEDHHVGDSPLLRLGTSMISQFPLDVMHLVYLGVTRRLYSLLLKRKAGKFKLPDDEISKLDKLCVFLSPFCPSDFARKPRPLSQFLLFKATEFRRLLLYDGFILQKSHRHKEVFECYLLLSCAMRILLDSNLRSKFISDAHELLVRFVKQSYRLLGASFVVYNVHHLLHLTADCNIHGDPEDFSAFKYETHLGQLKMLLIAPGRTIQQIVCRLIEQSLLPSSSEAAAPTNQQLLIAHTRGPMLSCNGKQYTALKLAGTEIRRAEDTPRNSCVLMSSGQVVLVENIVECDESVYVIGRQFMEKSDYFQFPIPSSLLDIFKVSRLGLLQKWRKQEIIRKFVYYPLDVKENEYDCYCWREGKGLCIPLLHSEV